ncbi:MAG: SpoIID/LytB domain-containing protein [Candidatus Gastranaerophilales bacterium]|nr:SpoIID/LytB domain-containing protein [Candidatus Gastranaerophilales bacterium]
MLKRVSILITLLLTMIIAPIASAIDDNVIRVGISTNNFGSLIYSTAEFGATGQFEAIDISTGYAVTGIAPQSTIKVTFQNGTFTVYKDGKIAKKDLIGPVIIKPAQSGFVTVKGLTRGGKPALYRGVLELRASERKPTAFSIVNVLSLENYLKGVVPNEMPVRFGLEALKAQAVAARNYAIKPRAKFYKEFDVCDSVACQVYFGANTEKELANKAIKETQGIVALNKNDEIILALYSSTAGGYSESYENAFSDPVTKAFPPKPLSHLKGQPDNKKTPCLNTEEAARAFYTGYPDTFDNASPYFRWKREWTEPELENVLKQTLIEQSKTGFVKPQLTKENASNFGEIKNIKALTRGVSGKIAFLEIETTKNDFVVAKELTIRRTFKKDGKALPSGNFVIDKITDDAGVTKYIFQGGGFGHGVGLSQFGAGGMAQKGYAYDEILQHYYTGIKLATPIETISSDKGQNTAEQIFYATNKKAWLNINNIGNIKEITVIINGKEIPVSLDSSYSKRTSIDISDYVKIGQNTAVYYIQNIENKKKIMKINIVLKEARND